MAMADHPMNVKDHVQVLNFLTQYRISLKRHNIPRRVLVMGFHSPSVALPLMEFFMFGDYKPFGMSHFPMTYPQNRYVQAEYDFVPFMANTFALVVAPELHMWHVRGNEVVMMNDFHIATELSRIIIPEGYFLANMEDLRGFSLHLVHIGFSRLDMKFGNVEVWQKDATQAPRKDDEEWEQSVRDWVVKHRSLLDRYKIRTDQKDKIETAA